MSWLNRLCALVFGLITIGLVKEALEKHQIIILNKDDVEYDVDEEDGPMDINDLKPENYDRAMDIRGTPTHVCPCGCNIFNIKAIFQNYEIATYFIDMECANCGTIATAPTPVDRENRE